MKDEYVTTRPLEAAPRGLLLSHLDIELTERCNNNCIHCYLNRPAHDRAAQGREMSTAQITSLLDEAAALGCLTVRFTGGEPLLRDDFEELYRHARRRGLKVLLFTNATLITPPLADLFAHIPPLERIEITVYGMRRASYEAVTRAPGSFEAFWRGMHRLLERRVPFLVKYALLPPNQEDVEAFETFAAALPWRDRPPGYVMFLDLRGRRDSEEKNDRIRELRWSPEEGVAVLARRGEHYLREMRAFCSRFTHPPGDPLFACGAGKGGGCVDAYGRFQMCLMLRHPETVYDLVGAGPGDQETRGPGEGESRREGDAETPPGDHATIRLSDPPIRRLRAALTDFFPRLREWRATHPDYLARCARCFLKGLCDQCPAKSWAAHGSLDTPVDYECAVAHARARHLGLLADGENAWEVQNWRDRIRKFVGET